MKGEKNSVKAALLWQPDFWLTRGRYGLVAFMAILLYANTIGNGYALDDELVTANHRFTAQGISALPEIFTHPYYEDQMGYRYGYRPIGLATFAIGHSLWGQNPQLEHAVNVLAYACLVVLLLAWLDTIMFAFPSWFPLLITVFFAIHPTHTEVVASLKNREEILSLLGGVSAAFLISRQTNSVGLHILGSLICFTLGVLSKNSILFFPFLIPWMYVFFRGELPARMLAFGLISVLPASLLVEVTDNVMLLAYIGGCYGMLFGAFVYLNRKSVYETGKRVFKGIDFKFNLQPPEVLTTERSALSRSSWYRFVFGLGFVGLTLLPAIYFQWTFFFWIQVGILSFWAYWVRNKREVVFPLFILVLLLIFLDFGGLIPVIWDIYAVFLALLSVWLLSGKDNWSRFSGAWFYLLIISYSLAFQKEEAIISVLLFPTLFYLNITKPAIKAISWGWMLLVVLFWIDFLSIEKHIWIKEVLVNLPGLYLPLTFWAYSRRKLALDRVIFIILMTITFSFSILVIAPQAVIPNYGAVARSYGAFSDKMKAINQVKPVSIPDRPLTELEIPLGFDAPLSDELSTATVVGFKYVTLLAKPYPLACYYGFNEITAYQTTSPEFMRAALGLLGLTLIFALGYYWKFPLLWMAWLWIIISIFPYSNLLARIPGMFADRYAFIPSLGWAMLLAEVFRILKMKWEHSGLKLGVLGLGGMLVLSYSGITMFRNTDWKDHLTLYRRDIEVVPQSAQLHNLLGTRLMIEATPVNQLANAQEAVMHFKQAIKIFPDFFNFHYDLGRACMAAGNWMEADSGFRQAERIRSNYPPLYVAWSTVQVNLGMLAEQKKDIPGAILCYQQALRLDTLNVEAYNRLAFAFYGSGQPEPAIQVLRKSMVTAGNSFDTYGNMAKVWLSLGQKDSAAFYFSKALEINPNAEEIRQFLLQLQ